MIISHTHRFIFIKTVKTAGTSLEIALSKYCGTEDVISPLVPEDEVKRTELGYRGAQNYDIPYSRYALPDILRSVQARKRLRFFNHAKALFVKNHLQKEVWDTYFKFCFERNPWDKFVSWYYWNYKDEETRPVITDAIQSGWPEMIRSKGWGLYTDEAGILVDRVFRYEDMDDALLEIAQRTGLGEIPALPHAKGNYRKDKRSYRDILSPEDRDAIALVFRDEIERFDYTW